MDLDAYRAAAQAFATDLNAAHHRRFAGLDGRWDPAALYARHAALFDERAIDALRNTTGLTPGVAALLRFAVQTRLAAATAATDPPRAAIEAGEGPAALAPPRGGARRSRRRAGGRARRPGPRRARGAPPRRRAPPPDAAGCRGAGARARRGPRAGVAVGPGAARRGVRRRSRRARGRGRGSAARRPAPVARRRHRRP